MSQGSLSTVPPQIRIVATNEKVTGPPAIHAIHQSGILKIKTGKLDVLDNATGGGVLVSELRQLLSVDGTPAVDIHIVAGDIDDNMLAYSNNRSLDEKWNESWSHVDVRKIDQSDVALPGASFTHIFNNFGVFFCRDDIKCLSETYRLLQPTGSAHFSTWKSLAWWTDLVQPAIASAIPGAPTLPQPLSIFPSQGWNDAEAITGKLVSIGFHDVHVEEFAFTPQVEAEEFAEACALLVTIAAKRFWSEGDFKTYSPKIQETLLDYLMKNYPQGKWNGKIVALIASGRK